LPLFEKSGAKTSARLGLWRGNAHGPVLKSFLLLFFKKEAFLFHVYRA
jgi:hypothetical protein